MIFITQGSDPSIGLEVFFKSCLCLSQIQLNKFILFASKNLVEKTLSNINIPYSLNDDSIQLSNKKITTSWVSDQNPTMSSLKMALVSITKKDTLCTLPSDKASLSFNNKTCAGYTEYLRRRFNNNNLCMVFKGHKNTIGLLTDHIPLSNVPKLATSLVLEKTEVILKHEDFKNTKYFLFSGLNPHSGENGILGCEDNVIIEAIEKLKIKHPNKKFFGPIPSDTIWNNEHYYREDSFTFFVYHDQGLGLFKSENKFIGANITYGLDFVRMSVDHGTAPDIAYKNIADYMGCLFVLKTALKREGL